MGKNKKTFSAKRRKDCKKQTKKPQGKSKVMRIQKQIQSDLSPKFTEMKTGARISRFGRPQKETKQDVNSIPTEIAKFIPKHSPKRYKPKDTETDQEIFENQEENNPKISESQVSGESGKENIPLEKPLDDITVRSDENTDSFSSTQVEDSGRVKDSQDDKKMESVVNDPVLVIDTNNEINEKKIEVSLNETMEVETYQELEIYLEKKVNNMNTLPADKEDIEETAPSESKQVGESLTADPLANPENEKSSSAGPKDEEISPVDLTDTRESPPTVSEEAEESSPTIEDEKFPTADLKKEEVKNMLENENFQINVETTEPVIPEQSISEGIIAYNFDDSITNSEKRESLGNHSDAASDTDSALGSSSSHKDMKDETFCPGDIVWGSFSRVSWYPCMVYPDDDGNIVNVNGKGKQIHVKYFNWNGYTAHLPLKNVFELKSLDDFWQQVVNLKIKKSKVKQFGKSCYKAIEEANFFKKYRVDERIKIFDEILKIQLAKKQRIPSSEKTTLEEEKLSSSINSERKSVDSALECSVSPMPLSPQYDDPAMKADPFEVYLQSMIQYEANPLEDSKRLKNRRPLVKTEVVPDAVVDDNLSNRRKSNRAVKKRTFEDYEEVGLIDNEPKPSMSSEASAEQKAKRPKVAQEKTLEDRFFVDLKLLRAKFKTFSKKRVCMECHELNNAPTYRCNGNGPVKCSGWFHQKCSGHFEQKREEIRHVAGDSEEIIQTQAIKTTMMCKACNAQIKNCFVCRKSVDLDDHIETQHCLNQECRLAFHKSCLKLWPQNKIRKWNNANNNKKNNNCPQHTCHSCFYKDIHKSGTLAKCAKCPAAYHTESTCIPAGTVFLSQTQIICPRHPSDKEIARNTRENIKPLNMDFCNLCPDGGNLVCCDSCPNAFHYDCIGYEETDEGFNCQECREGRLPLYNTIVWARVGAYRWWPALVMHDFSVPMKVLKTKKFEREFCVRFFGSYDYFYTTCERVLMYDGSNLSVKTGSSRLDSAFNLALEEAHEMSKILELEETDDSNAKPKPYTKIIQNRPILPVKMKKVDEHTQGTCNCKKEDLSPCGRSSDCINMHINFECDEKTCPAKEACQNQKLRKRDYAEVKLVKTQNRGFGLISVKDIPEDTFIIEYVGELIDSNEFNRRMKQKLRNKEKEFYFLTIEGDLYVDAEPAGNLARFINHSCDPNCVTRKLTVDGNTRIGIYSNQSIKAGTELTFDYRMEFVDNKKTACFCGSSKCSGLIGDKPIEEKKVPTVVKRKQKRKYSGVKILLPEPKRKRTIRDTIDPLNKMLEKMTGDTLSEVDPQKIEADEAKPKDPVITALISDESQAPVKVLSPLDFHVAGDSHLDL